MEADISRGWRMDEKGFLVAAAPEQPVGDAHVWGVHSVPEQPVGDAHVWGVHSVPWSIGEWAHDELVDLASSTPTACYRTLEGAKAGALADVDRDWEDMREYWEETPDAPGHRGALEWSDPHGTGRLLRAETYTGGTVWVYRMELI